MRAREGAEPRPDEPETKSTGTSRSMSAASAGGRKVSPMQLVAQILEAAVAAMPEG